MPSPTGTSNGALSHGLVQIHRAGSEERVAFIFHILSGYPVTSRAKKITQKAFISKEQCHRSANILESSKNSILINS